MTFVSTMVNNYRNSFSTSQNMVVAPMWRLRPPAPSHEFYLMSIMPSMKWLSKAMLSSLLILIQISTFHLLNQTETFVFSTNNFHFRSFLLETVQPMVVPSTLILRVTLGLIFSSQLSKSSSYAFLTLHWPLWVVYSWYVSITLGLLLSSNYPLGPKGGELHGHIQGDPFDTHVCFAQCMTYYLLHDKEDPQINCTLTCPHSDHAENSERLSGMDGTTQYKWTYDLYT